MDYDDLLLRLRDLLAEHDEARRRLSQRYRYIMVDEYQDTNRLQAHIAALLASEHGNLMVVGDDAQSIYSFRGADFRNIMDFPRVFPDTRMILLEENYRSTQPVLDLGTRSWSRRARSSTSGSLRGGPASCCPRRSHRDDHDQAAFVCERVLELREEGTPLSEIAVLPARLALKHAEIELGRATSRFASSEASSSSRLRT